MSSVAPKIKSSHHNDTIARFTRLALFSVIKSFVAVSCWTLTVSPTVNYVSAGDVFPRSNSLMLVGHDHRHRRHSKPPATVMVEYVCDCISTTPPTTAVTYQAQWPWHCFVECIVPYLAQQNDPSSRLDWVVFYIPTNTV